MTCTEALALFKRNPLDTTLAERNAMRQHVPGCKACRKAMRIDEPTRDPLAALLGSLISADDALANDPEAPFPKGDA